MPLLGQNVEGSVVLSCGSVRACVNGMRLFLTVGVAVDGQLPVCGIDVSRASPEEVQGASENPALSHWDSQSVARLVSCSKRTLENSLFGRDSVHISRSEL